MSNPLNQYEITLGALYGLVQFFVLPYLLALLNYYLQLEAWLLNVITFFVSFLCTTAIFHRFLLLELKKTFSAPWKTLRYAGQGLLLYYACNMLFGLMVLRFFPDYVNLNDASISTMAIQGGALMTLGTVLLAPVSEELLFRGLLFHGVHSKSSLLAWTVSTVLFSLVHITSFIGRYQPAMLVIAFLQYLPAGLCLAYAYRRSDSIIAPILMHIAINQIGLGLMG